MTRSDIRQRRGHAPLWLVVSDDKSPGRHKQRRRFVLIYRRTLSSTPQRIEVRVCPANPRRIAATETEIVYVPLKLRVRIGLPIRLVIGSTKMLTMPDMVVVLHTMARSNYASVLRQSWRCSDGR
jgi:hypothetical protein